MVLTKRKSGFGVPIAKWFREDLRDLLHQAFFDEVAMRRGLFHTSALRRVVDEHVAGRRDWSNRLWALLFLELWFREFID